MNRIPFKRALIGAMLAAYASYPLAAAAQAHGGGHAAAPSHPSGHGGGIQPDRGHPRGNPPHGGRGWRGDGVGWWGLGLGLGLGWGLSYYDYPYYYYPYPNTVYVYPQQPEVEEYIAPAPPVNGTIAPPPTQKTVPNWYYCASAKTYYPYVRECPEPWQMVPATPPAPHP